MTKIASTTSRKVIADSGLVQHGDVFCGNKYEEQAVDSFPQQGFEHIDARKFLTDIVERPIIEYQNLDLLKSADPRHTEYTSSSSENDVIEMYIRRVFAWFTPKEMINAGFLTENQLDEFNFYCFIRDPIQRYISYYFHTKFLENSEPSIEDMIRDIEETDPEYGCRRFINKRYKHYCPEYVNVLLYENYNEEMTELISSFGGNVSLPLPREKGDYRPDWSRKPVHTWLPKDALNKLEIFLQEDIEFYNLRR